MLNINTKSLTPAISIATLGLLVLSGCGSTGETTSDNHHSGTAAPSASSASASEKSSNNAVKFEKTWVKAGNSDMTAAFGEITNTTDHEIKIVGAESSVTDTVQLHTTEIDPNTGTSTMKQVDSFILKPGEKFTMEPGGNHIMFMNMKCSTPAGHIVNVTLKDDAGNSYDFEGQARDYSGAKEEYAPSHEKSMSGHSHSSSHDSAHKDGDKEVVKPECAQ